MNLIPNDWKYIGTLNWNFLTNKFYKKIFKSIFYVQTYLMEGNHMLSPDIWRRWFTDWFIKCYDGYIFYTWYTFVHFSPFNRRNP